MFDPRPFQPLQPYFDLTLGPLKQIYNDPHLPLSFSFTQTAQRMGSVKITLFDETGWEVDPYVWAAREPQNGFPQGQFQFGYKGSANIDSPIWQFNAFGVDPVYENNAFTTTISGPLCQSVLMSSNQTTGTVKEILNKLANLHNLTLKIDPDFGTSYMLERGRTDRDTTQKRELKHHKFLNESDWRYINRLCYYMRGPNGESGYVPHVDFPGGQPTLNIVLPKSQGADYTYNVQDPASVVVYPGGWRPSITFAGLQSAMDTHFKGHQSSTGYPSCNALNQAVTQDYQVFPDPNDAGFDQQTSATPAQSAPDKIGYICPESMPQNVATNSIRARHQPTASPLAGMNEPLMRHISVWGQINSAQLTIFGDPNIQVMKNAQINFNYPTNYKFADLAGKPHWSSGVYLIRQVEHTITPQTGFLTVLTLFRPNMKPPQQVNSGN